VTTYILVLILHGTATTAAQGLTLEQCQKAGAAWVKESSKLSGPSRGEFVCVPVEAAR